MRKGSITPFCSLSLMLVASVLLVLLESARVYTLDRFAYLKAENGIDSVCAEFQPFLWQQYGLLFLDGAYGTDYFSMDYVTETLEEQIEKNDTRRTGLNLLSLEISELMLTGFALATDKQGELFLNYVMEREKENLPLGIAKDLYEQYRKGKSMEQENDSIEAELEQAQQKLEELTVTEKKGETVEGEECLKELFGQIIHMKSIGILNLIFEQSSSISTKTIGSLTHIENRDKVEGNMQVNWQNDWYRKLLVLHYMDQYFTNFCKSNEAHFLDYEMEYVLCGKDTEAENLSETLERLLLLREACNMAALLQDETKVSKTEKMAGVIGLLAGENPAAVKMIQAGILVAWAYLESVLDVRTLVSGEKIAFIKSEREWTTDILQIHTVLFGKAKARNSEEGMDYSDYLKQLLFFTKDKELAYRMMEAMELSMHMEENYEHCLMNRMLVALQYRIDFNTTPLFYSLAVIGDSYDGKFYFRKNVKRSYIP